MGEVPNQLKCEGNTQSLADLYQNIFGISGEELELTLSRDGFYAFRLGETASDGSSFEEDRRQVIEHTNACLAILGFSWPALIRAFIATDRDWPPVVKNELWRAKRAGKSVGELLYDRTFYALDIENDGSGKASTSLNFQLPLDRRLTLRGSGEFWTSRTYTHPVSGEPFWPNEVEVHELEDELDVRLGIVESNVGYQLTFEGQISIFGVRSYTS